MARAGFVAALTIIAGLMQAAPAPAQQLPPSLQQPAQLPAPADAAPQADPQQQQGVPQGTPGAAAAAGQLAPNDPVGSVASVTGTARVARGGATVVLKAGDVIFKNDVLATAANSTLDITFEDETTFNLSANSRIAVNDFVYAENGSNNSALFDVARGTVAFVANHVAKTGDMKIATPTATLGIRGTSGLIEVPEGVTPGAAPGSGRDVAIKLYADANGAVGRIEVFERSAGAAAGVLGARLGLLSQAASGFAIRPGAGGRFAAAPLAISAAQIARDRGLVGRVHSTQGIGRGFIEQRRLLRQQPGLQQQRPNLQRQPGVQPQRPGQPGLQQQRPGLQQQRPGLPQQRPGLQQPNPQQPGLQRTPNLTPTPGGAPGGPAGAPGGPPRPAALPGQPGGTPLPARSGFGGPPPGAQPIQGVPGQDLPSGIPGRGPGSVPSGMPGGPPGSGPIPARTGLPSGLAPRAVPGPQPALSAPALRGGAPRLPGAIGRVPATRPVPGVQRVPSHVRPPANQPATKPQQEPVR